MKLIVNQGDISAPTVKTFFNNTIYAVTTTTRQGVGDYVINFDGNIFADQSKVSIEYKSLLIDGGTLTAAVEIPSTSLGLSSMNIQTSIFADQINIRQVNTISETDGIANMKLLIEVKGLAQLSRLLARLEQQPGIISARRLVQGS